MSLVKRHPIITFFVLSYVITWGFLPFELFGAFGPLVAALIVIPISQGVAGLKELGLRMIRWRVRWYWYAAALGIPLVVAVVAIALNVALGASWSLATFPPLSSFLLVFAVRLINPLDGPMAEEPGWRGFALPHLQAGRSPLLATLILALIVVVWHSPLVFVTHQLGPSGLLGAFASTFWFAWLFNHTGGSVFMTIVSHAAEGTFVQVAVAGFAGAVAGVAQLAWIYAVMWLVAAIGVVVLDWKAWHGPAPTEATTPPQAIPPRGAAPATPA